MANDIGSPPDDPMAMPPPYWRSSGAIFHVLRALGQLEDHLAELVPLKIATEGQLGNYFDRNPEPSDDDSEFGDICNCLWILESDVQCDAELAIFMTAIVAEDLVNQFCVYNLDRNLAEALERLSLPEKLTAASTVLGHTNVKGQQPYSAAKSLTMWRNRFAHGHCVDRPTTSLRHNHLIHPSVYPGVPDTVGTCIDLMEGYLVLSRYLASISKNPYTAGGTVEDQAIADHLVALRRYGFEGGPNSYDISLRDPGS